jgi:hypothetical protein
VVAAKLKEKFAKKTDEKIRSEFPICLDKKNEA